MGIKGESLEARTLLLAEALEPAGLLGQLATETAARRSAAQPPRDRRAVLRALSRRASHPPVERTYRPTSGTPIPWSILERYDVDIFALAARLGNRHEEPLTADTMERIDVDKAVFLSLGGRCLEAIHSPARLEVVRAVAGIGRLASPIYQFGEHRALSQWNRGWQHTDWNMNMPSDFFDCVQLELNTTMALLMQEGFRASDPPREMGFNSGKSLTWRHPKRPSREFFTSYRPGLAGCLWTLDEAIGLNDRQLVVSVPSPQVLRTEMIIDREKISAPPPIIFGVRPGWQGNYGVLASEAQTASAEAQVLGMIAAAQLLDADETWA